MLSLTVMGVLEKSTTGIRVRLRTDELVDEEGRVLVTACPVGLLVADAVPCTADRAPGVAGEVG